VLLVDESSPRCGWPLGRIVDVHRNSKDKLVRSVLVRTKSTILDRPVAKIVLLETVEHVEGEGRRRRKNQVNSLILHEHICML
jgi:hypothetical protein